MRIKDPIAYLGLTGGAPRAAPSLLMSGCDGSQARRKIKLAKHFNHKYQGRFILSISTSKCTAGGNLIIDPESFDLAVLVQNEAGVATCFQKVLLQVRGNSVYLLAQLTRQKPAHRRTILLIRRRTSG